jgi:hypothetical protein
MTRCAGEVDADHDGTVSSAEVEAWRERRAAARAEQRRRDAGKQRGR